MADFIRWPFSWLGGESWRRALINGRSSVINATHSATDVITTPSQR